MKSLFKIGWLMAFAGTAVMSLTLSSCGDDSKENIEESTKLLTVSTSTLNLDYTGTAETVEVTAEGVSWTATASETWIYVSPGAGSASGSVSISAGRNMTRLSRSAVVTFSAEGVTPVNVVVIQGENTENLDIETSFKYVEFDYYGDIHNTVKTYATFLLRATDSKIDEDGYLSTYPCNAVAVSINVPYQSVDYVTSGLFDTFTGSDKIGQSTFVLSESSVIKYITSAESYDYKVKGGTLIIKSFGSSMVSITMNLVLDDNSSFSATYTGSAYLFDKREGGDDDDDDNVWSTLTEDYGATLTDVSQANIYDSQATSAVSLTAIDLVGKNANGYYDYIWLLLFTEPTASADKDLSGTYTPAGQTYEVGRFLYGYMQNSNMYGTWYVEADEDGKFYNYANLTGGNVVITKESDGQYTFDCTFTDPNGHIVAGKITTPVTLSVNPGSSSTTSLSSSASGIFARPACLAQHNDNPLNWRAAASPVRF